jgi:hypothetical protein
VVGAGRLLHEANTDIRSRIGARSQDAGGQSIVRAHAQGGGRGRSEFADERGGRGHAIRQARCGRHHLRDLHVAGGSPSTSSLRPSAALCSWISARW